ncbi:acetyl-CoA C-acetyltransferase [Wenzhouxiangella sp. XN201]|uniref:acetyl-CoA C-acetyltransferase n=1 Tax=Wenzhouxiangella sp. XN201 TaxID=2710755 RepID=UPI0013C9F86B|nr:acetyl-CoA C-acetyltransferase [Wenzhouxiangella sp. XN201]NEZ03999.1 acetyl-CoA C-acetyltransferase [Wenzhouxiangella sp. XN201]
MSQNQPRRIAIIGGSRIPFCRSGSLYADQTNLDMLTAAFQGVVDRYKLSGRKLDQVIAGAVTTHSKDWNLAREAVLSTDLSPLTPAVTMQQACGTSLQAALLAGSQIAAGEIECALVGGTDTTSDVPIVFKRRFAQRLMQLNKAKTFGQKLKAFKGFSPAELAPQPPRNSEPRTGLSMGEHCERMAREWQVTRKEQDELALDSHHKAAEAWDSGFFDDLVKPHNGVIRDNIVRPDTTLEKLASLKPVFDRSRNGTLTAGNSTSLSDGAAAVLLASEEWAREHDLPVLAWLTHSRTAAVDYVSGDEGLLMAPTVAVSEMLDRAGLALQDFDFYEIHEAFAAQVLCTLKAWESEQYCRERLGRDQPLGSVDRSKMNVHGGSVAIGHPFAATGARIVATLAHILEKAGSGRGLISVCTAGGMGVAAIIERDNNGSSGRGRGTKAVDQSSSETTKSSTASGKKTASKKKKKKTKKKTARKSADKTAADTSAPGTGEQS